MLDVAEVERPVPTRRTAADPRWVEILSEVFRTQSYLLNEMFARYYGTRRSHWYLSDGGHFENTAAYELIRRRVPRIILLDNGRDEGYAFDDLEFAPDMRCVALPVFASDALSSVAYSTQEIFLTVSIAGAAAFAAVTASCTSVSCSTTCPSTRCGSGRRR